MCKSKAMCCCRAPAALPCEPARLGACNTAQMPQALLACRNPAFNASVTHLSYLIRTTPEKIETDAFTLALKAGYASRASALCRTDYPSTVYAQSPSL